MMMVHKVDPILPCGSCRKRHARSLEVAPRRGIANNGANVSFRRGRKFLSLAALALTAVAMTLGPVVPQVGAAAAVPSKTAKRLLEGFVIDVSSALEAAEEGDDGHDGHDGHDHGEDEESLFKDGHDDDHDGHDHGEMEEAIGEEGHDGHDHGDEDDNHDGHDHSDGDHDDDHDGHDHGDSESLSSTNNDAQELKSPWGPVILASIIVNLATLSGCLIIVMTAMHRGLLKRQRGGAADDGVAGHGKLFDLCVPAFAVGALIATAVFLIFPEALHLIEGGHDSHGEGDAHDDHSGHDHRYLQEDDHSGHDDSAEGENAAKFGCAILGGFLLPLVFSIFFHHKEDEGFDLNPSEEGEDCESCNAEDASNVETGIAMAPKTPGAIAKKMSQSELDASGIYTAGLDMSGNFTIATVNVPAEEKTPINKQLCASILLGDGFHNFADGMFIGAAFNGCSTATAISIVVITLFHEVAQELADFVILTQYAGLSVGKALVLNFLSGITVCLGGITFLAANPSDEATGIILAMAGGVYFNIAACETIPRLETVVKGRGDRVWTLLSVIVGTVPIGLVLLNHQHC